MILQRILESVHGLFGVLAAAALLHPAISLRRGLPLSRGMRWSLGLTTAVVAGAFALGLTIYEDYREVVKRGLFAKAPEVGFLFETKEHLAFAVLALALGGGVAALVAPRDGRELRRAAGTLFALAFVGCCVVVGLGVYIAAVASFPE